MLAAQIPIVQCSHLFSLLILVMGESANALPLRSNTDGEINNRIRREILQMHFFYYRTYAPVAFRYFRDLFEVKLQDFMVGKSNFTLHLILFEFFRFRCRSATNQ